MSQSDNVTLSKDIMTALKQVQTPEAKTTNVWVREYEFDSKKQDQNQFIFFLKPESSVEGVDTTAILDGALAKFAAAKIDVGAVRVCGGEYLEAQDIMSQHYGVISAISKQGEAAMSEESKVKLVEFNTEKSEVLGAHQFMAKFPEITPQKLQAMNAEFGTTRFAGGTYGMKITHADTPYIIMNPFHAMQLVPYYKHGNAIIVIEGITSMDWADLRNNVCGATSPQKAAEGSIRRMLLDQKDAFKLAEVNTSCNGCHMSAGPLEALVELRRFFVSETPISLLNINFGALLISKDVKDGVDGIEAIAKDTANWDSTEEKNCGEAADILIKA